MKVAVPAGLVRVVGTPLVNMLAGSWRIRTVGEARWQSILARRVPYIFVLWHEALVPLLWHHRHRQIAIIVSRGREGRYLSDYASGLGYRILSGSSSRGGPRALLGAVRALGEGNAVAITPDGPRGPRRELKPGVLQAAQRGAAWVVPLHATCAKAWRLRSWDRLCIPKPGAAVTVGYGEPYQVEAGPDGLARGMRHTTEAMARLEAEMGAR
ncbi:MAG: lysophospholipid acyltransferase family protein [Gemmatimonadales bacterium]|nr:lysophospholipid acyltransferase family protein [Gemmatimonadota bacterium]MCB9518187.1 lysophospholipid acyltransferase family protein [Gemmatimonadales bacterium]HPF62440.1 lysophospholipid acyltransferase family protein [Gemmatimonadales bacterium]